MFQQCSLKYIDYKCWLTPMNGAKGIRNLFVLYVKSNTRTSQNWSYTTRDLPSAQKTLRSFPSSPKSKAKQKLPSFCCLRWKYLTISVHSLLMLFLLSCLMMCSHWRAVIFCSSKPPTASQTLIIFEGSIPSLLRLQTRRRNRVLTMDGLVQFVQPRFWWRRWKWLVMSCYKFTTTHFVVSVMPISILTPQSHCVSRENVTSWPS